MTSAELRTEIVKLFPYVPANIADNSYAVLTRESFLKTSKYMKWILRVFNILGWSEKFDCDDFALLWKMLTSLRHAKSKGGESEGVACGVIWYTRDSSGGGHAVNFVKTENGWSAFEPQTGEFFELSQRERESVCFVLF